MRQHFRIVAAPDPQTLPRIIGIFSQRSLIPSTMTAALRGGLLHIEATLDDLDAPTAAIIAAKFCESVLVASAICDAADATTDARGLATAKAIAA